MTHLIQSIGALMVIAGIMAVAYLYIKYGNEIGRIPKRKSKDRE
jgi:hypothetical protein